MKPSTIQVLSLSAFVSCIAAVRLWAQDSPGINTGGAAAQESQTPGPSGQTDFQTDLFTGRFGYTIPIELAPARHGATPKVELQYSSANGNGWCGVGWGLDLGYIERETKYGVPVQWSGGFPVKAYDNTKGFNFSLNKKVASLVNISDGNYRAQVESDFMKFQLVATSNEWVVTDKSGTQYYFGSTTNSRMINPKAGWSATLTNGTFRWALDHIQTATGDTASIMYTNIAGMLYPLSYTYNGHINGLTNASSLQFILSTTDRADDTFSLRSGYRIDQIRLLTAIVHKVDGQMIWSNRLAYTTSPSTGRALLTSVTHYGTDLTSSLPPVTFGYSQQSFTFQSSTTWTNLYVSSGDITYLGLSGTLMDLADVDGDGLPDRIIHPHSGGPYTTVMVQHNTGAGFANPTSWTLGSQTYSGNSTSSMEDWSYLQSTHGRILDINGDGKPDWVVDPLESYFGGGVSNIMKTNYSRLVVQLNNSTNFQATNSWTNVVDQLFGNDGNGQEGEFRAVEAVNNVLMIDLNGDGLPDRVMLTRGLPYTNYVVQFNTGSGFTATNVFGPYLSQGQTNDNGNSGGPGWAGLQTGVVRLIDINGDGLPDRVMLPIDTTGTTQNGPQPMYKETNFVVELNNGYGFEPAIIWTNVNPYYNLTNGGAYTPGIADLGDDYQVALRDVNGDGLPDRIIACVFSYFNGVQTGYTNWFVQLNTGNGFANAINWGPTYNQGYNTDTNVCGIQATKATLIDINGDGLPDRVEAVYSPTLSSTYFVVSLSAGPFPDLLTVASNGLGGAVTATYKPSTQYDNTESPGASPTRQLLPFPQYTASSVSVYDGINPANTTTYAYSGGYWNFALRQFNGFAQATEVDPLLTTNIHWFHQAGGRNNSSYGEYADTTNTLGKEGMEYRTDTIGWDGNPYRLVLNQVGETLLNNLEHFGYVSQTIDIDYPATSGAYKAVAKQFFYDVSNGNLTNETDWGAVNGVNISQQSFTDISGDTVYHLTQFASLSNTNIVDKPQTVTLSLDSAGANILRQGIYSYDGGTGNVLQERHLICPGTYRTNSYGYDGYNNKAWSTNAAGIVTQTTYDSAYKTFPAQSTTASTFTTTTIYDPRSGKLAYSVNPAGMATTNLLDAFLRLTETEVSTTQNGAPTEWIEKYSYTLGVSGGVPNDSAIIEQNDGVDTSNGHEVIRYSDGFGRIVQAREQSETGNFRVIDTVYDPRGNPLFVSLPYFDSSSTSFVRPSGSELGTLHEYDSIGRPSKVSAGQNATFNGTSHLITGISATGGDPGVSPLGTNILAYYNNVTADPWTLVVTDEAGKVHQFVLDAYGRTNQIVEVTSGGNFTTTFTYNMAGDLLSVTDNAGHQIQYAYNDIGELIAMADPDMGNWQYERDYAGRLNHQIDGDGQRIDFNYSDPLGRLASRQVYDLRGGFVRGVTNIYDSTDDGTFPVYPGQLYKVIDSEGYSKTGYDVRGRKIIAARYVAKNGNSYTNRYTSDDMDRVTSIVYPNGGPTITNIYDHGANLYEVQQVGGSGTLFYKATAFTALDQIAGITYGNTVTASNIYYANSHRLKSIATTKGTNIQSLAYTYDQVADVKSITDGVYSDGGSASVTNITYDDLHRLTSLYRPTLSQTVNFSYDSIGNMTSSGENGGAYTYAPALPHAVHNANGQNYAYDRCGNMLVRGNQSLVYDQENRLIAVVASNLVTTFGYDEGGARLWKQGPTNTLQVWIDGNYEEKDGKILYHISAGDRVVCTFDASNTVFEYYHPDHLHSAEILSDNAGNLYQHYEYSAYGQSRYTLSSAAFPISRRYTSQVLDEETGLYFYASRYYDPQLGRFIQPDTIIPQEFNPQAYDRYAYALDNPFRFTDPSGHAGKEVADWWEGHVNRVYSSLTEGSESTLYLGTMGTVNSIVGGIVEPLRLGSDAGRVSVTGGTAGEVTVVVVQEGLRTISLVPVGSAIGKGAGTLVKAAVKSGGEEVAGEMAGELSGCFVAGTLVPCETGDVEIQNVKIGSRVWSYSFQSGEWELRTVEATPVHDYEGDVVTLQIGEVTIEATGNHPFWVISGSDLASRPPALDIPIDQRAISQSGRWVEARSLREGDTLLPLSGRIVVLDSVSTRHDHTPVYNLRVEGNHTYSVSQLRVLVHNKAAQIKQVPKADEGRLVRFGKGPETAEQLGEQSAKAEAAGFPHGVSTKLKPRTSGSDKLHRSAPKSEVEQAFPVKQTGSDPTHHTVILPKPVTPEAAETFNQVFTPKTGQ